MIAKIIPLSAGRALLAITLLITSCPLQAAEQTRDEKVLSDRKNVTEGGRWIYNDLAKGFEESRRKGMPLCVVLRCVP